MLAVLFLICFTITQNAFAENAEKIFFSVSKEYTDQIFLYYYNGSTMNDRIKIKLEDGLNLIQQNGFNVNRTTVFHYPGWGENASDGSSEAIVSAFLQKNICNVVVFDYSPTMRSNYNVLNYVKAVNNVTYVGEAIGEFFKAYIPNSQPSSLVKMVSFSLGSQILAQAARKFGVGKLERVTGLDPAGPLYQLPFVNHLNAKDGKFVDIIHTDGGYYGDIRAVGTADFFPNRGTRYQPGCDSSLDLYDAVSRCSHHRAYQYYAESILNPHAFLAKKCKRFLYYLKLSCNANDVAYMGYYVSTTAKGTYYLKTNSEEPFGQGPEGIDF